MTAPATGQRIAADGRSITLNNGHEVTIRYGMKSLLRLEEMFGSLNNVDIQSADAPIVGNVLRLMSAGLIHEHDGSGAPLTVDRLSDLLEPQDFYLLADIAGDALGEAFPTQMAEARAQAEATTVPFPGTTGTTPPPSPSDAPTSSSGT